MNKISPILKSPLFLFLFFGILLYAGYSFTTSMVAKKDKTITIEAVQFELQEDLFTRTWNRPPTEEELMRQIDNLVMDEIFYREAVALGLDKSDLAIKRRLRQMVEMMLEDFTTVTPTENQLRTYLNENAEQFITESKISFRHIYFGQEEKEEAVQLLEKIKVDPTVADKNPGKLTMIPDQFVNETSNEVSRYFGTDFTKTIMDSNSNNWFGPVASPFGYHLVKISERTAGVLPDLNDIWLEVEEKWAAARKMELKEDHYDKLKEEYNIVYEKNEKM